MDIEIGYEEVTVESPKEKKKNSKIYTLLYYFLTINKHCHMIKYTNDKKDEFEVKLTNKKSKRWWTRQDISLFVEIDSIISSSRDQRQKNQNAFETSTRVRFKSNMCRLVANGYLKDLGSEDVNKSIKLRKYKLLKSLAKDELEERVKEIYSESKKKELSNKGDQRKMKNKALPKKKISGKSMVVNHNEEVTLKGNVEGNLDMFNGNTLTPLKNMEPVSYIEERKQNDEFGAFIVETNKSQFIGVNGSYLNFGSIQTEGMECGSEIIEENIFQDGTNFGGVQTEGMKYGSEIVKENILQDGTDVPENANIVQTQSAAPDQSSALKVDKTSNVSQTFEDMMEMSFEMFESRIPPYQPTINNQANHNLLLEEMDFSKISQYETSPDEYMINNPESCNIIDYLDVQDLRRMAA